MAYSLIYVVMASSQEFLLLKLYVHVCSHTFGIKVASLKYDYYKRCIDV
jgi:hypothetical protein